MITEVLATNYPSHIVKQLLDDRQLLYNCLSWVLDGLSADDLVNMGMVPDMANAILAIEKKYSAIEEISMKTILEKSRETV